MYYKKTYEEKKAELLRKVSRLFPLGTTVRVSNPDNTHCGVVGMTWNLPCYGSNYGVVLD